MTVFTIGVDLAFELATYPADNPVHDAVSCFPCGVPTTLLEFFRRDTRILVVLAYLPQPMPYGAWPHTEQPADLTLRESLLIEFNDLSGWHMPIQLGVG